MTKTFDEQKFKPTAIGDTTIAVWQERDRLHICLSRKSDDKTLIEWWDDEAYEAIDDGFLCTKEAIGGRLEHSCRQLGALHQSAFDYWDEHIRPKRKKAARATRRH